MKAPNLTSDVPPPISRGPRHERRRCLLVGHAPVFDPVALGAWLQARFPDLEIGSVGSADELERALTTGPVGLIIAGLPLPWGDPADATRILAVLRDRRMSPSVATRVPLILLPTNGVIPERLARQAVREGLGDYLLTARNWDLLPRIVHSALTRGGEWAARSERQRAVEEAERARPLSNTGPVGRSPKGEVLDKGSLVDIKEPTLPAHMAAALDEATPPQFHLTGDLRGLATTIVTTLIEQFKLADCGLLLLRDGALIRLVRAGPQAIMASGDLRLEGPGLVAAAARTGHPVYVEDVHTDPRYIEGEPQTQSELAVPLRVNGQVIGVLDFQSSQRAGFDENVQSRIAWQAGQVALALDNTWRLAETEERLRRLVGLPEAMRDQAIQGDLHLDLALSRVLQAAMLNLPLDAVAVLLLNPDTQRLEYQAGQGFRSPPVTLREATLTGAPARPTLSLPPLVRDGLMQSEGFLDHHACPLVIQGQVAGLLEVYHRQPFQPDSAWLEGLDRVAAQAVSAIEHAQRRVFDLLPHPARSGSDLELAYDTTLEAWARAVELHAQEAEGHTERVTQGALRLAQACGLSGATLPHLCRGALLHDLGTLGIPEHILLKPEPLTAAELALMRKHPVHAYEWLAPIAFLQPALDIPYCHHEKWDGTGYPRGLRAQDIPLAARVFAVIDTWDTLSSPAPFSAREAWSAEKVREHLRAGAGTHFDPHLVDIFLGNPGLSESASHKSPW